MRVEVEDTEDGTFLVLHRMRLLIQKRPEPCRHPLYRRHGGIPEGFRVLFPEGLPEGAMLMRQIIIV